MDRGIWWAAVYEVAKSWTWLSKWKATTNIAWGTSHSSHFLCHTSILLDVNRYSVKNRFQGETNLVKKATKISQVTTSINVGSLKQPWLISHSQMSVWASSSLWSVIVTIFTTGGSDGKEFACNARDLGSIPGSGRSHGKGNGNPLQYSCLENSMDRGDWQVAVHRVAKSWTLLND